LIGFATHSEVFKDTPIDPTTGGEISLFRRLVYRFFAALALAYLTSVVVTLIVGAIMIIWITYFDSTGRPTSREETRTLFIMLCGMIGASAGATAACWLGTLLAPGGNQLGPVAKRAFISAALGLLAGGWLGGMTGGLQLIFESAFATIASVAAIAGALAGMSAAIVVRQRGNR
jgi:hypothetical protein